MGPPGAVSPEHSLLVLGWCTVVDRTSPLPCAFFERDADVVARALLGCVLVHEAADGGAAVRVVETEAYFGPRGANPGLARRRAVAIADVRARGDPASHSFSGRTERNRAMWGPAGRAYVYLIYGRAECLNVVTGGNGDPQAVLLRAAEPVSGLDSMRRRRGAVADRDLARGPGNLCRALAVTRADYGHDLARPPLWIAQGAAPPRVVVTPRINVVGAEDAALRFVDAASRSVSGRSPHASWTGGSGRPPRPRPGTG